MKLLLTPDKATLTAMTVTGLVTIPLRSPNIRMTPPIWRQFVSHSPRKRWQTLTCGTRQLIF